MILVTGATGGLGSATIDFLLEKTAPANIAALVRNPEKAADLRAKGIEIRVGDYNDTASLVAAFTGVDKLYFVSGSDVATRTAQHQNVVQAAQQAGVGHIVYSSFDRKTEDGDCFCGRFAPQNRTMDSGIGHSVHGDATRFVHRFITHVFGRTSPGNGRGLSAIG
jgi:NAD(P)H dehydrogenase (quinone)